MPSSTLITSHRTAIIMELNLQPKTLQRQVLVTSMTAALPPTATETLRAATPKTVRQLQGEPT